jgi:hypothetical protein
VNSSEVVIGSVHYLLDLLLQEILQLGSLHVKHFYLTLGKSEVCVCSICTVLFPGSVVIMRLQPATKLHLKNSVPNGNFFTSLFPLL